MALKDDALRMAAIGLSCLPIEQGTKKFKGKAWKEYQTRIMADAEIKTMFSEGDWLAVVCGEVSKNLELIDFDIPGKHELPEGETGTPPAYKPFMELCKLAGYTDLLKRLLVIRTKSGGMHLVYRCPEGVSGNQKLAMQGRDALIETRGEGGYFLTYPTPGYKILHGSFDAIPDISADEREFLHNTARNFNEVFDEHPTATSSPSTAKPGDDFNQRASWEDILTKHGWTMAGRTSGNRLGWVRPGKTKKQGIGATTGNGPGDLLFVHTSSAPPFDPNKSYSKFAAFALLECRGDYFAAAAALKSQGYGQSERTEQSRAVTPYQNVPQRNQERDWQKAEYEKREAQWLSLADVTPEEIPWLFERRFARGMFSIVQGDPGEGKSTIARAITAMITTGVAPEFWGMTLTEPGNVIWLTKEESLKYSVVPALKAMGADLSRVFALNMESNEEGVLPADFILDDWGTQQLREKVEAVQAKAIILDPLIAFFDGQTDTHKQRDTRQVLSRLIHLGEQTQASPIGIIHQNKGGNSNPLYKGSGSIDFGAAPRTVFMVGHDPDDRERKAFVQIKSNLGKFSDSLGFEITEDGALLWDENCELDAARLLEQPSPKARKDHADACKEWLEHELRDFCEVTSLIQRAKEQGFSRPTVYRVASELDVSRGYQPTAKRGRGPGWWAKKGYDWRNHEWPDPFA